MMVDASSEADHLGTISHWQRFWFVAEPRDNSLVIIRIGMSLIASWYFASHWVDAGHWFSEHGILATEQLGRFLGAQGESDLSQWKWSPLYLTNSLAMIRTYLAIGIVLAIASAFQHRSRLPSILLWLWCVWLANRSLIIAGSEELALSFGLAYLAIAKPTDTQHWSSALARRMIQTHITLLIGITGLTMLSSTIWWDGTGIVAMVAPVGRRFIDLTELLAQPWLHDILTHLIVIIAIAGPVAIWFRQTRMIAYLALLVWCIVIAIVSSQCMYFATLAILLQSFLPLSRSA